MGVLHHRNTIWLFITAMWSIGFAQDVALPLSEWRAKLSVKEDIGAKKLSEVFQQVTALDSAKRCEALTLLQETARKRNARFQIRLALIRTELILGFNPCQESVSVVALLENELWKAYEIDDQLLVTELYQTLGRASWEEHDAGMSLMYRQKAYELRKKIGEHLFRDVAFEMHHLGNLLYKSRDYREAVDVTKEAVAYPGNPELGRSDTLSTYWKMNAWNNIGLAYEHLAHYDSALVAFDQAYALSQIEGAPFWSGLIKGNRGDVFFMQGRYDSAETLLRLDYEQSIVSQQFDNAALSLSRLARISSARGDHYRALEMLKEADRLEQRAPHPDYRAQILYAYALVYKDLNETDSTFLYMQQYKERSDALEKLADINRNEIAKLRIHNQESVYNILELHKEKRRIALIRNFSIALIVVLAALGLVYINRLRIKSRLKQHEALEAKRFAEAEVQKAREQLTNFTESLREKNRLIEDLRSSMLQKELNHEQIQQIQELTQHTILTDTDWERFKSLFTRVYSGFFVDLKRRSTDISLGEQRMAALIKLQISNKDAATMLGVSLNSVHKTRQRLRQRLGFEHDSDLEDFFRLD